jgi:hypothetical protein
VSRETIRASLRERRAEVGAVVLGVRIPDSDSFQLEGEVDSASEPPTLWSGEFPLAQLEPLSVTLGPEGEFRIGYLGQPSDMQLSEFQTTESATGLEYSGVLRTDDQDLQFQAFTDPEPFTIVLAALLATGCIIDWKTRGGRAECLARYEDLAEQCLVGGGFPDIHARSTLGIGFRGGLHVGCHIECDFVCRPA